MYKKFEQETAMGDNIFLKEMKEIQFEDYFKYDAKCRGNLRIFCKKYAESGCAAGSVCQ